MSRSSSISLPQMLRVLLLLAPGLCATALADGPPDVVRWTVTVAAEGGIKQGGNATLEVSGVVDGGWHVYALMQQPGGPTPLRVALETNDVAAVAGPVAGSAAEKAFSQSFGLTTEFYSHAFSVRLPVRLSGQLAAGRQQIPLSVRFQACSDRECLLPRTLHLAAPIDVPAGG